MGAGEFNATSTCNPAMNYYPIQRGVEIFLVASCYKNWHKIQPERPIGSYADFTYLPNYLKTMIQIDNLVSLFYNSETTDGLPVLAGIFSKEFIAQTRLGFTTSKKHCAADPETSKT